MKKCLHLSLLSLVFSLFVGCTKDEGKNSYLTKEGYIGNVKQVVQTSEDKISGKKITTIFKFSSSGELLETIESINNNIPGTKIINITKKFDDKGRIVSDEDTRYGTTVYKYDDSKKTYEMVGENETLVGTLNDLGLPLTLSNTEGKDKIVYTYNELGLLTEKKVIGNVGRDTIFKFQYDEKGRLTKETTISGREKELLRDSNGWITQTKIEGITSEEYIYGNKGSEGNWQELTIKDVTGEIFITRVIEYY